MTKNLLIAGGSVRAAAESAIRAGFTPWCVDCFGDVDLVRACPTRVSRNYPRDIPEIAASAPPSAWMYTGAMENHPEIVTAVNRPLYGNRSAALKTARSSTLIGETAAMNGVSFEVRPSAQSERMLLKPFKSGGGIGIRFWAGETFDPTLFHLQEYIEGEPMSAVFLAGRFGAAWLGTTLQLIGTDWLHAPDRFLYCGSIRDSAPLGAVTTLAKRLAEFGIRGLVGIDAVFCDGEMVPIEVNPRYTASIEILERATGRSFLSEHVRHFTELDFIPAWPNFGAWHPGKAILYAPIDFAFPKSGPWDDDFPFADLRRRFADLPHPGQHIRRGQPVLTFFADGDSPASTEAALRKIAGDLDRLLFGR